MCVCVCVCVCVYVCDYLFSSISDYLKKKNEQITGSFFRVNVSLNNTRPRD